MGANSASARRDVDDLIKVIGGLADAPARAQQARDDLRTAMATLQKDHPNHPVLEIAAAEADKSPPGQADGPQPVSDFVDDDGNPIVHPAIVLTDLVKLICELYGQLDQSTAGSPDSTPSTQSIRAVRPMPPVRPRRGYHR